MNPDALLLHNELHKVNMSLSILILLNEHGTSCLFLTYDYPQPRVNGSRRLLQQPLCLLQLIQNPIRVMSCVNICGRTENGISDMLGEVPQFDNASMSD